MTFYIYFFLVIYLYLIISRFFVNKNNLRSLIIPIVISVFFAGLRGNVGTDTYAYKTFFNSLWSKDDLLAQGLVFSFEPGFVLYSHIIKVIFDNDQFFIFSVSCLYGFLFYKILKNIEEKDLFLLLYISNYYVMFNFNLIRFGIAVMFLGLAYLSQSNSKRFVYYCLGVSFHLSVIFAFFFFMKRKNILRYVGVLILGLFFASNFLQSKFDSYFFQFLLSRTFKLELTIILEIVSFYLLVKWNKINLQSNNLLYCILLYFVFRWLGYLNDVVSRISFVFGFVVYLSFFKYRFNQKSTIIIAFLILLFSYRSLSFIYKSDNAMDTFIFYADGMSSLYSQTKWLPFKFFWNGHV
jgi:hypothetical protein